MKKFVKIFVEISVLGILLSFTSACGTYDEDCAWCGDTPTKKYKTSNGSDCYVCKDCSSECMLCGDKATKHYTNMLDLEMFVCDDCYDDVVSD